MIKVGLSERRGMPQVAILKAQIKDQKTITVCPSCQEAGGIQNAIMHEEGEEHPIYKCRCGWWGTTLEEKQEDKMSKAKKIDTKHRTKQVTKEQEEIIAHIQAAKDFKSYLEAKNEYFENQEKYDKMTLDKETKTAKKAVAETKPEEPKEEKRKGCMSIAETKLGVTMVLSKSDCKAIGILDMVTTKEAIKTIRAKLSLPEKSLKD